MWGKSRDQSPEGAICHSDVQKKIMGSNLSYSKFEFNLFSFNGGFYGSKGGHGGLVYTTYRHWFSFVG